MDEDARAVDRVRRSIPIILAHQWDDPMAHIGIARPQDVKQVERGLQVKGKLDVDDNPVAKQVYKLMKRRSLKEFSIGYDVPAGAEKRARDGANEISQINLAECGPCLKGIDPKTELQAVKSVMSGMTFKQLASFTRELLDGAGRERYGAGQDTYVYVDDLTRTVAGSSIASLATARTTGMSRSRMRSTLTTPSRSAMLRKR